MSGPLKLALIVLLSAMFVLAVGLPLLQERKLSEKPPVASTEDAQEFDQLWLDIQSLQDEAPTLGASEFKLSMANRTSQFLRLPSEGEDRFVEAMDAALNQLGEARSRLDAGQASGQRSQNASASILTRRGDWSRWREAQQSAADNLLKALDPSPRQQLFSERRLLWLLRLDHSMRAAVPR